MLGPDGYDHLGAGHIVRKWGCAIVSHRVVILCNVGCKEQPGFQTRSYCTHQLRL